MNALYNNFEAEFLVKGRVAREVEAVYDIAWNRSAIAPYMFLGKLVKSEAMCSVA